MNAQFIGNQLKKCRNMWGFSIEKVANDLNISIEEYTSYELGLKTPSDYLIRKFSRLAQVDASYIKGKEIDYITNTVDSNNFNLLAGNGNTLTQLIN